MQWCELGSSGSECIAFMDLCENSNEPSGFIKNKKCLAMSEWLSASRGKKKTLMCEVSGGKRIIQVFRSSPVIHWSLFDDTLTDRWIYSPISMKWFMNQRWILNVYITLYGIWSVMRKLYTIFVLLKEKQQYAWICSPCTISIFLHVSF